MFFNIIKHNLILIFCILLVINGCNNKNSKLIIENNYTAEKSKKLKKLSINKIDLKEKLLKNTISEKNNIIPKEKKANNIKTEEKKANNIIPKEKKTNNIIFEFRNERLLQGRDISNNIEEEKTKLALSAVQKMFKKNLSSSDTKLNLKNNDIISTLNRYVYETIDTTNYQHIIVFLPLTGKYSSFGNKIRKSLDISILNFGNEEIKLIYFDTGKIVDRKLVKTLFNELNPKFIIGPFTREILLKIKPFAKKEKIPILTFSNDIAMAENNVWSLGFSPEEQIQSVISCAIMHGYSKFGIIAPDSLYGKIITKKSIDLISIDKKKYYSSLFLSNEDLNNKTKLYSILRRFLQYSKSEEKHTKFDTILIGGRKNFILEIAPLLAFFNVDSRFVKILGTETFNNIEIKNEPSLEKSWFPAILSKKNDQFKLLWKDIWGGNNDYFINAGFDAGVVGINYINNMQKKLQYFDNVKGPITGLIFDSNGYVKKPIQVMQIEDLGKLTKIKKCSKFKH